MRKKIYELIKNTLIDGGKISHVDLYNEQLLNAEQEVPFLLPAVLVEFSNIQWHHLSQRVREADVEVRLHVLTDSRTGKYEDSADVFDLLDEINGDLHNLNESGNGINDLVSVASETASSFGEMREDVEVYACHVVDCSAMDTTAKVKGFKVNAKLQGDE